jgi:hypothetical protein
MTKPNAAPTDIEAAFIHFCEVQDWPLDKLPNSIGNAIGGGIYADMRTRSAWDWEMSPIRRVTQERILAKQAAQVEPKASSACPICGKDDPHGHEYENIVEWLRAQGRRFIPDFDMLVALYVRSEDRGMMPPAFISLTDDEVKALVKEYRWPPSVEMVVNQAIYLANKKAHRSLQTAEGQSTPAKDEYYWLCELMPADKRHNPFFPPEYIAAKGRFELTSDPYKAAQGSAWTKALEIRTAQGWKLSGKAIPVLYTDEINGQQVCRDDVWLATTAMLKAPEPNTKPASSALVEAAEKAKQLCDWIAETPHQRGSINGLAAQAGHALHSAIEAEKK